MQGFFYMCEQMPLQHAIVRELLFANVTHEWLLTSVDTHVRAHVTRLRERAVAQSTVIQTPTDVQHLMSSEGTVDSKLLLAFGTRIWLLASMHAAVLCKLCTATESLATAFTLMRFISV